MSKTDWKKERDNAGIARWRSKVNREYTVEIVSWRSQNMRGGEEGFSGWGYGYNAKNGKGIQSSPHFFEEKKDAIKWALNYMKKHKY